MSSKMFAGERPFVVTTKGGRRLSAHHVAEAAVLEALNGSLKGERHIWALHRGSYVLKLKYLKGVRIKESATPVMAKE